jgi:hypothetical protein
MANHGYISKENKHLTFEELNKLLNEINNDLFGGTLNIDIIEDNVIVVLESYELNSRLSYFMGIFYHGRDGEETFKCFETRHSHRGQIFSWLEGIFSAELAIRIDGVWFDEGVDFIPEHEYVNCPHSTFKEYVYSMFMIDDDDDELKPQADLMLKLNTKAEADFPKEFFETFVKGNKRPESKRKKVLIETK